MLLLSDLRNFANAFTAERQNIENNIVTAEHDEASKLYKDVVNAGDLCTLFVLIPSHDDNSETEDAGRMKNNLTFIIMKKADTTAGNEKKLEHMALCQLEILALAQKIKTLKANFGTDCLFNDIDLSTLQIDPLSSYLGANGYTLSFATQTKY